MLGIGLQLPWRGWLAVPAFGFVCDITTLDGYIRLAAGAPTPTWAITESDGTVYNRTGVDLEYTRSAPGAMTVVLTNTQELAPYIQKISFGPAGIISMLGAWHRVATYKCLPQLDSLNLQYNYTLPIYGSVTDIPSTLVTLALGRTKANLFGHVYELPDSLQAIFLQYSDSTLYGSLTELPSGLQYFVVYNTPSAITGSLADIPETITNLTLSGTNSFITGALSDLHVGMSDLDVAGTNSLITGSLSDIPPGLGTLYLGNTRSVITGALSDISDHEWLYDLDVENTESVITGALSDLNSEMWSMYLTGSNSTITGGSTPIPCVAYPLEVYLESTNVSQADLDSIIARVYADRALFSADYVDYNHPGLYIGGSNPAPSGVYQDADVPTTALEMLYKLVNDPDEEGFVKWATDYGIPRAGLVAWHDLYFPNVLLHSNNFANASWAKVSSGTGSVPVVTAGQTDPYDGANAYRVQFDKGAGTAATDFSILSQTSSVYANPHAGSVGIWLRSHDGASEYQMSLYESGASAVYSTVTVTGTWQRFTYSNMAVFSANGGLGISLRGGQNTSDSADVDVYAAEYHPAAVLPPYEPTTSQDEQLALYSKTAQKRNLLWKSEEFGSAPWALTRATITPDVVANPLNGIQDADLLVEDATAANTHKVVVLVPATGVYSLSVYAKRKERNLTIHANNQTSYATFDLSAGSVAASWGLTGYSIEPLGDGWYRCCATGSMTGGQYVGVALANDVYAWAHNGDGTSGAYIYGAQLELGSVATPYESTQTRLQLGSAATTTTNDPVVLGPGLGFVTDDYAVTGNLSGVDLSGAGTMICAALLDGSTGDKRIMAVGNTNATQRMTLNQKNATTFGVTSQGSAGMKTQAATVTKSQVAVNVIYARWEAGATIGFGNLSNAGASTCDNGLPSGAARLVIGADSSALTQIDAATYYSSLFYNRALSDAELQRIYRTLKATWAARGVTIL